MDFIDKKLEYLAKEYFSWTIFWKISSINFQMDLNPNWFHMQFREKSFKPLCSVADALSSENDASFANQISIDVGWRLNGLVSLVTVFEEPSQSFLVTWHV